MQRVNESVLLGKMLLYWNQAMWFHSTRFHAIPRVSTPFHVLLRGIHVAPRLINVSTIAYLLKPGNVVSIHTLSRGYSVVPRIAAWPHTLSLYL